MKRPAKITTITADNLKKPEFIISAFGLILLGAVYINWYIHNSNRSVHGLISSFVSVVLFAVLCLRFVPELVDFFRKDSKLEAKLKNTEKSKYGKAVYPIIFLSLTAFCMITYVLVYLFRMSAADTGSFTDSFSFWRCLDSNQYIHIAEGWYPSEGAMDELVCLVFLPAYPILIKLFAFLVGDYLLSAFLISVVCFGLAGCALYKLILLDYDSATAARGVKYMCLLPGAFFYAAPMSESLFILFFILCIYFVRTDRWLLSGLCGAITTFTRSLGLVLFGILLLEFFRKAIHENKRANIGKLIARGLSVFSVLLGFGAYLLVNYSVSGNPFQYMIYQREHWSQNLGWFFNTAEYQLSLAVNYFKNGQLHDFAGLWLPNLIAIFGSLIIMIKAVKKLRASLSAGFIAYFVIAIGATWLLSAPRYMCACLPVIIAAAVLTEKRKNSILFDILLILMDFFYLYAFAMRWNVW